MALPNLHRPNFAVEIGWKHRIRCCVFGTTSETAPGAIPVPERADFEENDPERWSFARETLDALGEMSAPAPRNLLRPAE